MADLRLKVAEAIQDDVNRGIIRIDSALMKQLEAKPGEVLEINGKKSTVALVDRAYPGDIGLNIIRMDGDLRKNAETSIGETVSVKKADVKLAEKVKIAPARTGIIIKASPGVFKQSLLGRAMIKGDIISLGGARRRRMTFSGTPPFDDIFRMLEEESAVPGFGFGTLKFVVIETSPKGPVMISENTEVVVSPEAVEVKEDIVPDVTYEDIGGLNDEITKIREMVELPLKHPELFERLGIEAPKGVLLHGPPGTGKTLLAKAVANESNSHFILINGPEIMSKFYGESEANLRGKFEEAEKNAPSIIFLDEIDSLAPKREEVKGEVERRVVAQLLALMDGLKSRGRVVVIAATNVPNVLDPALRRPGRFDREIEIGVPSKQGRLKILKIHTRSMPLAEDVKLEEIAEITHGFVGADMAALAKEAAMNVLRKILPDLKPDAKETIPKELLEKLIITKEDFIKSLKTVRPSALREVLIEKPSTKWEDIGGLELVKQELKEAVEWPLKNPDAFKRMGIKPPKGVLLYGPPGTGKTLLAKAVANETQANFILVKGPEILSKWINETPQLIKKLFEKARQVSPSIVFIDEIDSITARRDLNHGSNPGMGAVETLLTELDGLEDMNDITVLAASNRPDIIDPALLRPGRFDRIILTPVPGKEERKKIFEVHTNGMPIKAFDIDKIVEKTEGFVGADIEALCREAAMLALRKDITAKEVKMNDFNEALKVVKPSTTKEIEKNYEELRDEFRKSRAEEMKEKPTYMG